jgi:uncharacterized membrane protein
MKTNQEFKRAALDALRGNWGKAVIATLVYILLLSLVSGPSAYTTKQMQDQMTEMRGYASSGSITQLASTISSPEFVAMQQKATRTSGLTTLLEFLVILPFTLGFMNAFLRLLQSGENQILRNALRIGFSNYWHKVWGMLLMYIFLFLWSLLLIIPGIIKAFSYAMTPYILEENPELGASEAIDRSRMMMRGHKFDLFWLYLSFIGWFFLCLLTAGIGFLWLNPYVETAKAAFYEEVKADYALNGGLI